MLPWSKKPPWFLWEAAANEPRNPAVEEAVCGGHDGQPCLGRSLPNRERYCVVQTWAGALVTYHHRDHYSSYRFSSTRMRQWNGLPPVLVRHAIPNPRIER
jgi:hypothetical protein